jgi:23S rRNA (guanosine2251-2'-O)-methyltransferase
MYSIKIVKQISMAVKKDLYLVYGAHPIIELLKAKKRKLYSLYTTRPEPKLFVKVHKLLHPSCTVHHVTKEELTRRAGSDDHQGLVGYATTPLEIRKKAFSPETHPFLVMLEGIHDARNIGAIIRSAYCSGADGIVITQKNSGPLNAAALKASAGLAECATIYITASAAGGVKELKDAGYTIYLAALGGKSVKDVQFKLPAVVVVGNEGYGISSEILHAGTRVMLPQRTSDISYNASVAAGILLFIVAQQCNRV